MLIHLKTKENDTIIVLITWHFLKNFHYADTFIPQIMGNNTFPYGLHLPKDCYTIRNRSIKPNYFKFD
jgi:hypothetical protein